MRNIPAGCVLSFFNATVSLIFSPLPLGVGGSADSWQNQLTYFSGLGYEVVAPDLLGHGFSSTPDKVKCYTFAKLFRDVLTVFDHFCVAGGRPNSTVIIGHSYGGSFATAIARSRPDHVKVLVSAKLRHKQLKSSLNPILKQLKR